MVNSKFRGLICALGALCFVACGSVGDGADPDGEAGPSTAEPDMGYHPDNVIRMDDSPDDLDDGPIRELPGAVELGQNAEALKTVYMFGMAIPNQTVLQQPFPLQSTINLGRCGSLDSDRSTTVGAAASCVFPIGHFQKTSWTWSFLGDTCPLGSPAQAEKLGPGIGNHPPQCAAFDYINGTCAVPPFGPNRRDFYSSGAFSAFQTLSSAGMGITFTRAQDNDPTADILVQCGGPGISQNDRGHDVGAIARGTPAGNPTVIPGEVAFGDGTVHCASNGEDLAQVDLGQAYSYRRGMVMIDDTVFWNHTAGWLGCLNPSLSLDARQKEVIKYAKFTVMHELGHVFSFQHTRDTAALMGPNMSCSEITAGVQNSWPTPMYKAVLANDTRQGALAPVSTGLECLLPEL